MHQTKLHLLNEHIQKRSHYAYSREIIKTSSWARAHNPSPQSNELLTTHCQIHQYSQIRKHKFKVRVKKSRNAQDVVGQQLLGDSKYLASLLELPSPSTSSNLSPSFPTLDVSMDGNLW
jgi:hypothetical protein